MRQITILGTGLIGGSLALALKRHGFTGRIVGCDRSQVLAQARALGAIDLAHEDAAQACANSDVVVLATPVGAIMDLLDRLGPLLPPDTLFTDVGSTKGDVITRARDIFGDRVGERFLAGHPMAGKENSGIDQADADLFTGAVWLFTPLPGQDIRRGRAGEYVQWIERIGARVLEMDSDRHDRLCAWISHLPQMLSTALAAALQEEFGNDLDLEAIGGRALREMTRLARSPYSMWRDIALTNTANIQEALQRLEQRLFHLRENLRTRELEMEFDTARRFRKP
ncbi:MAG: prephenate dehydrogenase/arogenate dehydrogenase family protein [Acidobacteriia bacterium]|nr:prephenate dehydrogenase/arogenate dehydrogenase family protein [Terriglobia bacterium]